jgi:CheY-like chemotaxis protein
MRTGSPPSGFGCYASSFMLLPHLSASIQGYIKGPMRDFSTLTNVLVLEDDANDAILIKRAFTSGSCRAFVCRNTSEARAYFLGSGMYSDRELFPFPDLFVTDLRLGEESGIQFLAWVRAFDKAKNLPVVVLSGAATPGDILAVQRLRATRVLIKPADAIALQDMLTLASRELCPMIHRYTSKGELREAFAAV